jgi:NAD(P)H dehydrogenase (quinone)
MSTLIVTAHPDPSSLTHHAAVRLQESLAGGSEIAHLAQEGFDPRFTQNDRTAYVTGGGSDSDITAEQNRIDRFTDIVFVFPVYWWSMPALLKGWIDRVFVAGWAFGYSEDGKVDPKLWRLTAHLLPISGTSEESFDRHGYTRSLETQVGDGIFKFCGMKRGVTAYIFDSESQDETAVEAALNTAVASVASAIHNGSRSGRSAKVATATA